MNTTLTGAPARFAPGLRDVAPNTYAWLQPNGGLGESNAGIVVGDGAAMLIDTLWDHRLTRTMLAAMRPALADAPLTVVLNTHADGDHWWGNHLVPSDAEIVSGTRTARAMGRDVTPRELALLQAGLSLASRLLPGRARAAVREGRDRFAPFAFAEVRLRHPVRTFSGETTFDVGGREVRAIEVGPAHSQGDTIAHVPDVGVVFTADVLFVGVTPIMWAGPVENWIGAMDLLLSLDVETYVPGHGDVGTREDVERMAAYWTWLREQARDRHGRGQPTGIAARELLAHPDFAWSDWDEPERIVANIDAIYRALDGRAPVGARSPGRIALMHEIAALGRARAR